MTFSTEGQISAQRCVLEVNKFKSKYASSVDAYVEEMVIRRELSDNFCFYNPNYDSIKGAANWAQLTLREHSSDKRPAVLTKDQLEHSKTHDDLWNAAQIQLVREGKMHGFLRMYWAKKILEWTTSPEEALKIAIYLNDKYSLDGRDPSGYVGEFLLSLHFWELHDSWDLFDRLHVVHLRHTWHGLEGKRHFWQDPLHELRGMQAQIRHRCLC